MQATTKHQELPSQLASDILDNYADVLRTGRLFFNKKLMTWPTDTSKDFQLAGFAVAFLSHLHQVPAGPVAVEQIRWSAVYCFCKAVSINYVLIEVLSYFRAKTGTNCTIETLGEDSMPLLEYHLEYRSDGTLTVRLVWNGSDNIVSCSPDSVKKQIQGTLSSLETSFCIPVAKDFSPTYILHVKFIEPPRKGIMHRLWRPSSKVHPIQPLCLNSPLCPDDTIFNGACATPAESNIVDSGQALAPCQVLTTQPGVARDAAEAVTIQCEGNQHVCIHPIVLHVVCHCDGDVASPPMKHAEHDFRIHSRLDGDTTSSEETFNQDQETPTLAENESFFEGDASPPYDNLLTDWNEGHTSSEVKLSHEADSASMASTLENDSKKENEIPDTQQKALKTAFDVRATMMPAAKSPDGMLDIEHDEEDFFILTRETDARLELDARMRMMQSPSQLFNARTNQCASILDTLPNQLLDCGSDEDVTEAPPQPQRTAQLPAMDFGQSLLEEESLVETPAALAAEQSLESSDDDMASVIPQPSNCADKQPPPGSPAKLVPPAARGPVALRDRTRSRRFASWPKIRSLVAKASWRGSWGRIELSDFGLRASVLHGLPPGSTKNAWGCSGFKASTVTFAEPVQNSNR